MSVYRPLFRATTLSLALAASVSQAASPGVHQHGFARLDVVLQADHLLISLDSPWANVLGFEHEPATDAERAALAAARQALEDAAALFGLDAAAGCTPGPVTASSTLATGSAHDHEAHDHEEHDHGEHDHGEHDHGEHGHGEHDHEEPDHDAHSDLRYEWQFRCQSAEALTGIDVHLFDRFEGFERIEVQWVVPAGQGGGILTGSAHTIQW